ncbi:hypothetical protein SM122_08795 [Streptococcus sp. S2(2023)]|uniref:Phage protein n=1 Tax=Streptococcus gingivalis TaxID=3111861 RepID=A0ABU6BA94_9STRE|nr:hypothetical protein [Streptococcus sp. S2(2023)]MEB3518989.1 hypothetical protein [Streptococcus sp. S2(2023)]MEB3520212.1 hypothetical protein [Streptococcus sp. S2(2023)]MEB3520641.1 hypothetical protein [Streptococcus sp. S2(2023)]
MTFKVVNKYLQETNKTFVAIRQDAPYTAFDRVLIGDRTSESDDALIEAVLGQIATEFNPADGVKKLQEDLHVQAESYEQKLAEKDTKIAEVKAVADWAVLARVTDTDNPLDPTIYKRGLELVDLGQSGKTYKSQEIFAIEDATHNALYGEGNRVMVQVNSDFTYNGETIDQLASLEQNGKLAVWKWTKPKENTDLETQPLA